MSRIVIDGQTFEERSLDCVIDDIGYGNTHRLLGAIGGGITFIFGGVKQLVGVIAVAVAADLGFSDYQRGWLASVIFVGNCSGNLLASFADVYGRRLLSLAGILVLLVGWILTSWATTFWAQVLCRFFCGLGFGIGGPPFLTLLNEVTPTKDRLFMTASVGMVYFTFGMAFAMVLVYYQDPQMGSGIDWRQLTAYTAAPGLLMLPVAGFFLIESPRFYAAQDRREEATKCLEQMRNMNGRAVAVHNWTFSEAPREDLGLSFLWHRSLRCTTLTLCLSTFVLNYSYYGGIYGLPQVLPSMELGLSPVMVLIIMCLVEVLGYGLTFLIGSQVPRQMLMVIYLSTIGLLTGLFAVMLPSMPPAGADLKQRHYAPIFAAAFSLCGSRLAIAIGWTVVYLYAVEVYPTAVRATGTSFAIAFGRLGSILAPLSFEVSVDAFWWTVLALCVVNATAVSVLPIQTKDRSLGEIAAEVCPIKGP